MYLKIGQILLRTETLMLQQLMYVLLNFSLWHRWRIFWLLLDAAVMKD